MSNRSMRLVHSASERKYWLRGSGGSPQPLHTSSVIQLITRRLELLEKISPEDVAGIAAIVDELLLEAERKT